MPTLHSHLSSPVYLYLRERRRHDEGLVQIPEPDEWEIALVKLIPGKEIGRGAFGTVRRGIARDLAEDLQGERRWVPVAPSYCRRASPYPLG